MKKYIIRTFITMLMVLTMVLALLPSAYGTQFHEATAHDTPGIRTPSIIPPGIITPGIVILDLDALGLFPPADTSDWPEPVACVVDQLIRNPVNKHGLMAFLETTNIRPKIPCPQEHLYLRE